MYMEKRIEFIKWNLCYSSRPCDKSWTLREPILRVHPNFSRYTADTHFWWKTGEKSKSVAIVYITFALLVLIPVIFYSILHVFVWSRSKYWGSRTPRRKGPHIYIRTKDKDHKFAMASLGWCFLFFSYFTVLDSIIDSPNAELILVNSSIK